MPELPEVEYARACLSRWMKGKPIERASATPGKPLRGTTPRQVAELRGRRLTGVERHGKHLLLTLDRGLGVHLHLGMTGKLLWRKPRDPPPPHEHVRFELARGAVCFADPRRFGRFEIVESARLGELPEVAALGPDALDSRPDGPALAARLTRTRRPLKVALMDQALVAGLGNIQAAEVLWRARLSPYASPQQLAPAEWKRLAAAVQEGLRYALDRETPRGGRDIEYVEEPGAANPFLVYGRAGEPCRRCGTPIVQEVQGQRSTYFCPTCQPPRPATP
ncbi:MAG: bifunctional DNA-formamidopyrimidine glycosylase/DNA-(apurinic or apyrimidinic site) lyase [Myxococcales bacterium]